jgi:hypothetical protein
MHTSYWLPAGGYKRRGTFMEYTKNLIDCLNAYHSEQKILKVNNFTKSVDSIHYYDSMIVIEKKQREAPHEEMTGNLTFQVDEPKIGVVKSFNYKLKFQINRALRFFRLGGFLVR